VRQIGLEESLMASIKIQLPTIQNWSCHNCSGCCRQHVIEITDAEKQRIIEQGWTAADGVTSGGVLPLKSGSRLAHQPDGACIFLADDGLCKIHAKFGEAAKPLACRIYPYAFHPAGNRVTVSLRFSCPSVVENKGQSVESQRDEIRSIARLVVPKHVNEAMPPQLTPKQSVSWPDFHRFVECFDRLFANSGIPILSRVHRAIALLSLIQQSTFEKVKGDRLDEYLEVVTEAAAAQTEHQQILAPGKLGRTHFRMLVAQYSRKDTSAHLGGGLGMRWNLLTTAVRFARGKGTIPRLQETFPEATFATLETPFGGFSERADEFLTRYFRVKLQGIHFCGPAYYDVPFVEGLYSLLLVYPAVMWFARWFAVGDQRDGLINDDVATAISVVDHHHGFSAAFGMPTFRKRVRALAKLNEIERLSAWYSR
jgi:lysine-N-methylase